VKELGEATELVLAAATPLEAERVPLDQAAGRVAAEEGRSAVDLPPFDRSAMDGYAVRSADTTAGTLRLVGEVAAGETSVTSRMRSAPGSSSAHSSSNNPATGPAAGRTSAVASERSFTRRCATSSAPAG